MRDLHGATAIVTGASRGLGPYIAAALGTRGVALALLARSRAELEAVAHRLGARGTTATAIPCDIADDHAREAALTRARAVLGRIDIVVSNAAIQALGPVHAVAPERVDEVLHLNVAVPMRLARSVLPEMLAARRGHIVNVASAAGPFGLPYQAAYAASKAALISFTRSLREECRETGVSASVVVPSFIVGTGMYERERDRSGVDERAPWMLTTSPRQVAQALVSAIERDRAEIVVNRVPLRPALAALALFPGIGPWILRAAGIVAGFRHASEKLNR